MCIGRRKVFIATVLNFSMASGVLAFTPDNDWIFLSIFRFFVGFGVGGLYASICLWCRSSCRPACAARSAGWSPPAFPWA